VTEAILAGKQVEKFAQIEGPAVLALIFAEVPRLSKDFLMSDSPGDACDCKTEKQQKSELLTQGKGQKMRRHS
jgi:hypothetical protein